MSNCKHCGAPLADNEKVCSYCGSAVLSRTDLFEKEGRFFTQNADNDRAATTEVQNDRSSVILNIIAFIFPVIGFILYLRFKRTKPVLANSLKTWVIIGFLKDILGSFLDAPYNRISSVRFFMDGLNL